MHRRSQLSTLAALAAPLVAAAAFAASPALAARPVYAFSGGTPAERAQVRAALAASSFDWGLLPQTVTVHIGSYGGSYATLGDVFLDASILDTGVRSWGIVQHELAHQVDFFLLDGRDRARLNALLGGETWCWGARRLAHANYGCERFASELAWAYWPSRENVLGPASLGAETSAIPAKRFRALLSQLVGAAPTRPGAESR